MTLTLGLLSLAGYLLGSIPCGVLLARIQKVDLRQHGSGNIGATNVARTLGKRAGVLTLLGDALKGVIAVVLAEAFLTDPWHIALVGLMAFLGHLFPVFLKFRGGKGVATGLGLFLYLMPLATLPAMVVFGVTLWIWRYVSLSSMLGALAVPVFARVMEVTPAYTFLGLVVAVCVILRHHENIRRLMGGTENRFGSKK